MSLNAFRRCFASHPLPEGSLSFIVDLTEKMERIALAHSSCASDMKTEPSSCLRMALKFSRTTPTKRLSRMKLETTIHVITKLAIHGFALSLGP